MICNSHHIGNKILLQLGGVEGSVGQYASLPWTEVLILVELALLDFGCIIYNKDCDSGSARCCAVVVICGSGLGAEREAVFQDNIAEFK